MTGLTKSKSGITGLTKCKSGVMGILVSNMLISFSA